MKVFVSCLRGAALITRASTFGPRQEIRFFVMIDLNCSGNETNIFACDHRIFGISNQCDTEELGVVCSNSKNEFTYIIRKCHFCSFYSKFCYIFSLLLFFVWIYTHTAWSYAYNIYGCLSLIKQRICSIFYHFSTNVTAIDVNLVSNDVLKFGF